MTSSRPDKDSEGAGVSISLAVAGVVAAGLGLLTMHTAFRPLPKPGVPVVISHADAPVTQAAWRHAQNAKAAVQAISAPLADETPSPARRTPRGDLSLQQTLAPADADPVAAKPAAAASAAPVSAKLSIQQVASADVPGEKMCKAPAPQLLTAKALQPAMILRYDAKFKAPPIDIAPEAPPPSDDTERRIRLSALLSNILQN